MKSALSLTVISLLAAAVHGSAVGTAIRPLSRDAAGYVQIPFGSASFTNSSGCVVPACGMTATGFTAAMNQLSYGAPPGSGAGDACGRCFRVTGTHDPYSTKFTGPFNSIVVKVTNLCAVDNNQKWCGQTTANPLNSFGQPVHFDMCPGADVAFFPPGHGALTGTYQEVPCSEWSGTDGSSLWKGSCLAGESADFWPAVGCGNKGTAP